MLQLFTSKYLASQGKEWLQSPVSELGSFRGQQATERPVRLRVSWLFLYLSSFLLSFLNSLSSPELDVYLRSAALMKNWSETPVLIPVLGDSPGR